MDSALLVDGDDNTTDGTELLEEPLPEPSRTLTDDDRLRIIELCEAALDAQLEGGRTVALLTGYNLGIVDLAIDDDEESIALPHYAPRRGAPIDLIGALATGCPKHPQGPVGAVARALFIRFEFAEALETGWHLSNIDSVAEFAEYDRKLLEIGFAMRQHYAPSLAVTPKAA